MDNSFKFSNYVICSIKHKGMKNKWFADILKIKESSFSYKLKNDSFSVLEVLLLSELLDIDLGRVQEDFKEFMEEYNNKEELEVV